MDLFQPQGTPAPTRIGQANGEFLAHLALMEPARRRHITVADFPHATPSLIRANVAFHAGGARD